MIPELGHFALILALCVSLVQGTLPLFGAQYARREWIVLSRPAAQASFLLLAASFAALAWSFYVNDFSVLYVAEHSNSQLPTVYRFGAVWGGHEGSLLLWVFMLSAWAVAVAFFSRTLDETMVARVLGVLGLVMSGLLLFILFTSNPFNRLLPAAENGRDLNPLLQDPGLVFHPPMLYMGYVGFAVAFAFAIAALLSGRLDAAWARWSRPWTTAAWVFLTLGIALGSWWAYYELGWGGWWFWDPVENASFMPWLVGAALIHSQAVTEKRGAFRGWTLLLAIAAFSLSLLGTFLVRSGVITSVHAFAADPSRGVFILVFLGIVIGSSLLLYAWRAPQLADDASEKSYFAASSRETLLLANNLLLAAACAMVLLGTLYPLIADALDLGKISVGPPYFSLLFIVLMAPLVALVPFGPLTKWQRDKASRLGAMLLPWLLLSIVLAVVAYFVAPQGKLKAAAGILGAAWVGLGTVRFVWSRLRTNGRFTPEMVGMTLAHTGIAVFLVGALLVEALNVQRELAVKPGQTVEVGRWGFHFQGVDETQGPNYLSDRGHVQVLRDGRPVTLLHPEKRAYASGGQVMTEAGIRPGVLGDVYVAIGEPLGDGAWALRVHIKPFVRWIWLGAALMALGGFVTAADRRFRNHRKSEATPA